MAEKKRRDDEKRELDVHMRLTKSEMSMLDMLSYEEDKTRTGTVVKALTWYLKFKKGKLQ
jgi:hypothetical protein